jgi:hypothetical protein
MYPILALARGLRYPSMMEIQKIIAQLREERDQMNEAILSLERLVAGQGKRRGRPPLWLQNATAAQPAATDGPKRRGRASGQ